MSDSLDELRGRLRAFAQARNWEQFHSPKNLATALSVESGELLEIFQWLTDEESRHLTAEQRNAASMEIADVLLYLVQLAAAVGVDPVEAAARKMSINEKRYPVELARGSSRKYTEF
jgi:dCTP diphosphatase